VRIDQTMRKTQLREAEAEVSAPIDDAVRNEASTLPGKPERLSGTPSFARLLMSAPLEDEDIDSRQVSGLRCFDR
jgi:hypothetical protein